MYVCISMYVCMYVCMYVFIYLILAIKPVPRRACPAASSVSCLICYSFIIINTLNHIYSTLRNLIPMLDPGLIARFLVGSCNIEYLDLILFTYTVYSSKQFINVIYAV